MLAWLSILILTSCGGGEPTPRLLSVEISGQGTLSNAGKSALDVGSPTCLGAGFQDSGYVVYVLAPRGCEPVENGVVRMLWGDERGNRTIEIPFAAFGDETAVVIEAGHSRIVSVHQRGTWRSFPNTDSWPWRDGAGLLVKDGTLFLLGGWSSDAYLSDVWSSRNVRDWSLLTSGRPWGPRHGAGWVVHRDRMYVISGDLAEDVWSSADGIEWTLETQKGPFGKRYAPNAVSDGNRIYLYAGQYWGPYDWCADEPECFAIGLNDVWATDDGQNWGALTYRSPWAGRGLVHGGAYFNGRIYVVGGGLKLALPGMALADTVAEFTDIWSSADGFNWRKEADTLGFTPRTHFSLLATPRGCYVSDGSVTHQPNLSNDVYFAPDCIHFAAIPDPSPMQVRHASSLAYFNGSIVILGGHRDTAGTEVWQYFPDD